MVYSVKSLAVDGICKIVPHWIFKENFTNIKV